MADLEQERVTALWREAAARLAPAFRAQPLTLADVLGDVELESQELRQRAEKAEAECTRLREQLDATREALRPDVTRTVEDINPAAFRCYRRVTRVLSAPDPHDPEDPANSLDTLMAILHSALVDQVCARAALGVVGEQENP